MKRAVNRIINFHARYKGAQDKDKRALILQQNSDITTLLQSYSRQDSPYDHNTECELSEAVLIDYLEELETLISIFPCGNLRDIKVKLGLFETVYLTQVPADELNRSEVMIAAVLADCRGLLAASG